MQILQIIGLTVPQALVVASLLVELFLMGLIPRLDFNWHRKAGWAAVGVATPMLVYLGWSAGQALTPWSTRALAEALIQLYALAAATWLAWKSARPF